MLAAFLLAQLEKCSLVQTSRKRIWQRYRDALTLWAERHNVTLPLVPADCSPAYHLFHMLMPSATERTAFIAHMKAGGIQAIFHYVPLNASPMGQRLGGQPGTCPITESASERLVRLPFYTAMTDTELARVIERVQEY
jgi:dTDP-4-amino-4,6-dideoxygalactose transaminase